MMLISKDSNTENSYSQTERHVSILKHHLGYRDYTTEQHFFITTANRIRSVWNKRRTEDASDRNPRRSSVVRERFNHAG